MALPPQPPVGLYIKVPHERPIRHGVHSTSHHDAHRQMLRYSKEEFDMVEDAATLLGITPAVFVREAAINTAKALKKAMENENANHTNLGGG